MPRAGGINAPGQEGLIPGQEVLIPGQEGLIPGVGGMNSRGRWN